MLGPGLADQRRRHRPGQRDRAEQQQRPSALRPDRHFDPDSKRPYDIEYTLGVEREVASGVSVSRHLVSAGVVQLPADDQPTGQRLRLRRVSSAESAAERRADHHLQPQPGQAGVGRFSSTPRPIARKRASPTNGFEVTFRARLPKGGNMFGGWSAGKSISVACAIASDPATNGTGPISSTLRYIPANPFYSGTHA